MPGRGHWRQAAACAESTKHQAACRFVSRCYDCAPSDARCSDGRWHVRAHPCGWHPRRGYPDVSSPSGDCGSLLPAREVFPPARAASPRASVFPHAAFVASPLATPRLLRHGQKTSHQSNHLLLLGFLISSPSYSVSNFCYCLFIKL